MKKSLLEYKIHFKNKEFLISFVLSIVLLFISLVVNFYAGQYATESASGSVTDIILSNTKAYDLDGLFVYGSLFFFFITLFISLLQPKKIPFLVKSIALFVIIRSFFISLTHIGPFPSQIQITSDILSKLTFGGDLFFSGHTGLPFLLALIFWQNRLLRYIFLIFSIGFGIIVLLAHLHYSIDVLSAFFITYSIFHIAKYLFKRDEEIFHTGL
jgi:hypothetical protein